MNYKKLAGCLAIISMLLVSCSKKTTTGVEDVKYTGPKMVNFGNYQGYQMVNITLGNKWIPFNYEVKLANTTGTASAPIIVKLVKDDNPIYEYNTANGTSLTPIPPSAYRFDTTEVIIRQGARSARVHFEVNPAYLDLTNVAAFGISIFSVKGDGAVVSTNEAENSLVVELGALNEWDGAYKSSNGYFYHPTSPRAIPAGTDKNCYTTGANTVATELGDFNGVVQPGAPYYVTLTIDATNHVTISPGPGAAPSTSPVVTLNALPSPYTAFSGSTPSIYNNTWDPVAKKFYLRYGYLGGATLTEWRVVEEVLTKQ